MKDTGRDTKRVITGEEVYTYIHRDTGDTERDTETYTHRDTERVIPGEEVDASI